MANERDPKSAGGEDSMLALIEGDDGARSSDFAQMDWGKLKAGGKNPRPVDGTTVRVHAGVRRTTLGNKAEEFKLGPIGVRPLPKILPPALKPFERILRNPLRVYRQIVNFMIAGDTERAQTLYTNLLIVFKMAYDMGVIDGEYFVLIDQLRRDQIRWEVEQGVEETLGGDTAWDAQTDTLSALMAPVHP